MKNKKKTIKARTIIAIIGIAGIVILEVNWMPASYVWAWVVLIIVLIFAFSPEIKRVLFGKKGLELEHFQEQVEKVDKALVEYDEFKKTIYPLLKITLSEIAFQNYLGISAKPDDLIDFLNRIDRLPLNLNDDEEMRSLIKAVEVRTISSFNDQLAFIREKNGLAMDADKYVTIKYPHFSDDTELTKDDVGVDFKGLEESSNKIKDLAERARYQRKIKQLKKFYKEKFE